MPQLELSPAERKALKGDAHHLDPVVMIGADGLTDAVRKETDAALNAHGLACWAMTAPPAKRSTRSWPTS